MLGDGVVIAIIDAGDDVGELADARFVEDFDGEKLCVRCNPTHRVAVGGGDAGNVGAVAVIVHRVGVVIEDIVAADDFEAFAEAAAQRRVGIVNAGIDNSDDHAVAQHAEAVPHRVGPNHRNALVEQCFDRLIEVNLFDVIEPMDGHEGALRDPHGRPGKRFVERPLDLRDRQVQARLACLPAMDSRQI